MNQNACLSLGHDMAEAVLTGDLRRAEILAADHQAAWIEPQPVDPWTPHNQRNSTPPFKPGCAT